MLINILKLIILWRFFFYKISSDFPKAFFENRVSGAVPSTRYIGRNIISCSVFSCSTYFLFTGSPYYHYFYLEKYLTVKVWFIINLIKCIIFYGNKENNFKKARLCYLLLLFSFSAFFQMYPNKMKHKLDIFY